jgi:hypothetical protein
VIESTEVAPNVVYMRNSVVYFRVHEFLKSRESFEIPKWTMDSDESLYFGMRGSRCGNSGGDRGGDRGGKMSG